MSRRALLLGPAAVVVAYLALVPVGTMIVASLRTVFLAPGTAAWTLGNYASMFTSGTFRTLLTNSFGYAAGTAVAATAAGFALAWLAARTNTPLRSLLTATVMVALVIPSILETMAWLLLLSPQAGALTAAVRSVTGLRLPDVYSLWGMIFIQSMHVMPIAYIMGRAAFASVDVSLEEAAMAAGASRWQVTRKVTLPLVRPAMLSAALLVFVATLSSFEVPQLVGMPGGTYVFVSQIFQALQNFPIAYGTVGATGTFILAITGLGVLLVARAAPTGRFQTIGGRGYRTATADLGRWRWAAAVVVVAVFALLAAVPVLILVWSSLLPVYSTPSLAALAKISLHNYATLWHYPQLALSVRNSVVTSVVAGVITTVLATCVAYLTGKTRLPGRRLLDVLSSVPLAVPGVLMGVGILYWYLAAPLPVKLYGTLALLVVCYVTITLPYGVRYLSAGMAQVRDELEDAGAASGASWPQVLRLIHAPLLRRFLLGAFLYTVVVSFREISAVIFLYSQGSSVVSVAIYNLWSDGQYPVISALGVLLLAFIGVVLAAGRRAGTRIGFELQ